MRAVEIEGFTKVGELEFLSGTAAAMPAGARVVEIGSWKGRSTVAIAEGLLGVPNAHLWCVDTFAGDPVWPDFDAVKQSSVLDEFRKNTASYPFVEAVIAPSSAAAASFADGSLDWVFIDALHDFRNVARDIRTWAPKVKPGGLLSGHDYGRAGVTAAVRLLFDEFSVESSIWTTRSRPKLRVGRAARSAARRALNPAAALLRRS